MAGMGLDAMGAQGKPPAGMDDEDGVNVSPEEQALYETTVLNALAIIYAGDDEKPAPKVIEALSASENPIMNLATAAVSIVTYLVQSAKEHGSPIPDEILYHAGTAIVEELAAIAEREGIHEFTEEQIEQAFYQALDMYRTAGEQSGDVDPEALKQGFEVVRQADAEGRLDDVLPGIGERLKQQEGGR